ncbi:TMEM165/GDT1 family protein [Sphingobium sp. CCH11-B1]|jgi:putative Ca2+/H+ antiporter (TMEM165/GDT1 family)|uniref:TMEM165/GDT1 family protein n=1 Tax=Sphingobium sp. CCH11-B1 TaxID=1768781 RepID=UPI000836A665|nr:TMEM165/GDT1 family protein [Sphingobium sp. CCH11-B1]MEA3390772.1 TMEM165/GDT1 family protein [Pseudomonadota bacterium]
MDALLTALLGCLLGEMGDKSQLLVAALAARYDRNGAVIAGVVAAAIANAALSTLAGAWIGPMMGPDARLLFLALSILFLGAGLCWRASSPDLLTGWPTGPFLTTALGLFILQFGDGPQFLILGAATRSAQPVLAGIGGTIGILAALLPAVLLRDRLFALLPIRPIRLSGGALLLLTGATLALSATGLL